MSIVTFEQAKKLKELGFKIQSNCGYVGYTKSGELISRHQYSSDKEYQIIPSWIKCCLVSEALQWIRDNKEIVCNVDVVPFAITGLSYIGKIYSKNGIIIKKETRPFDTHPEAESALLDAILTYLATNQ